MKYLVFALALMFAVSCGHDTPVPGPNPTPTPSPSPTPTPTPTPTPPVCTPAPMANAGSDQYIVLASGYPNFTVIGTAAVSDMTYSWSPAAKLDSAVVAQPVAKPVKTTKYVLTTTNKCGSATAEVTVHVYGPTMREVF